MKPTVLKTEKAVTTIEESNIVFIEVTQGEDLSLKETLEIFHWVRSQLHESKHYLIVEAVFGSTVDPGVREWLSSIKRQEAVAADAFIVNSIAHKNSMNFHL
ncbi:MAG: cell division GTPase FtsZ [Flavobacteriales bacterium]|jgi:cell division GTPase FtsZ